jgi:serine protease Do
MLIGVIAGFVTAMAASFYFQNSSMTCQAQNQNEDQGIVQTSPTLPPPDTQDLALTQRLSKVFNYVAKNVSASVVHITAEKTVKTQGPGRSPIDEDFLRRFFPDNNFRFGPPQQRQPQVGLGSGVIIDPNGYIVTNNHVVEDADKIKIVLPDGREVSPEWVRTDPPTDLALIKIDAKDLFALELADSEKVEVGDIVLAVGNPFGLDKTVTQGIVSYIGRGVRVDSSINYSNYIQTDAAINPGNSGGPLVNLKGRIIGINSAIISRTSSYAGIGFAIPSNTVKFVVDQLRKSEKVVRSYLGVQIQNLTLPLAKNFGLDVADGALVSDVGTDTPASKAGLKSGDIILEFNGVKITDSQKLQNVVAQIPPGTEVKVVIWRDKKKKEITMKMEKMPQEFLAGKISPLAPRQQAPEAVDQEEIKELGLTVQTLDEELNKKYNFKPTMKGAVIVQIDLQGEGARAGLSEGDLITKVQDQEITSAKELAKILSKVSFKEGVTMFVRSAGGGARFVYIKTD